jgi:hypothetical protein
MFRIVTCFTGYYQDILYAGLPTFGLPDAMRMDHGVPW